VSFSTIETRTQPLICSAS